MEGVSCALVRKDDGVRGGVRRVGGRRVEARSSISAGNGEGEDAKSSGLRCGRCRAVLGRGREGGNEA